mgnify:CR=1 FL=1
MYKRQIHCEDVETAVMLQDEALKENPEFQACSEELANAMQMLSRLGLRRRTLLLSDSLPTCERLRDADAANAAAAEERRLARWAARRAKRAARARTGDHRAPGIEQ